MFKVGQVIAARRFGTKQIVTQVTEAGVYTKHLMVKNNELVIVENAKEGFVSNETLKERGFIVKTSMSLKVGSLGSAWK